MQGSKAFGFCSLVLLASVLGLEFGNKAPEEERRGLFVCLVGTTETTKLGPGLMLILVNALWSWVVQRCPPAMGTDFLNVVIYGWVRFWEPVAGLCWMLRTLFPSVFYLLSQMRLKCKWSTCCSGWDSCFQNRF